MKKVLCVILAAVMLASCLPFTVFAFDDTIVFDTNADFSSSHQLASNVEYIIPEHVTMTVPAGLTLYIPSSTKLTVNNGGKLKVLGNILMEDFSQLYAYGEIENGTRIKKDEGADHAIAMVQFRFPDLNSDAVKLADKITVSFHYDGMNEQEDPKVVPVGGGEFFMPLNQEIQINAHILEDFERDPSKPERDKFDDRLLNVSFNTNLIGYVTGSKAGTGYFSIVATSGGDIFYANWTNDSDFLTTKRIVLPSGEGYECLPRFPDQVQKTEDGAIVVKYGDPFSFYVDVDEAYDMSNYEVYIYNGYGWLNLKTDPEDPESLSFTNIAAQPDDYGYFNIAEVTGDITISVRGIIKNSTINLIGNLLETFKNIFNMLKEFFEGLKELFGGLKTEG